MDSPKQRYTASIPGGVGFLLLDGREHEDRDLPRGPCLVARVVPPDGAGALPPQVALGAGDLARGVAALDRAVLQLLAPIEVSTMIGTSFSALASVPPEASNRSTWLRERSDGLGAYSPERGMWGQRRGADRHSRGRSARGCWAPHPRHRPAQTRSRRPVVGRPGEVRHPIVSRT